MARSSSLGARLRRNLRRIVTRPFQRRSASPATEDDLRDLEEFSGLGRGEIQRYLRRERGRRISTEFDWLSPGDRAEYTWFYRGSRTYLFNVGHAWDRALELAGPGLRCLDFGGGGGLTALGMAERGAEAHYVDIGIINAAFVAFRARKRGLKVVVLDPLVEEQGVHRLDSAEAARREGDFDLVVCDNVLEHVPDYHLVLRKLAAALKPGGRILECTPFKREKRYLLKRPREWDVHLKPKVSMPEAMAACGMQPTGSSGLWIRTD